MNILIINHYAGAPKYGMEFRPYYLAKEWIKLGHNVEIIGGQYSHLRKNQPLIRKENIDGILYHWIKMQPYNGNGVGRFLSMVTFIIQLWFNYKKYLTWHPDIVIASSTYPLDVIPSKKIAVKFGAKLIYEVHDLWPLSPIELGGYSKYHPFIQIMQFAEDYAYKYVDAVVSMLPNAEEHMKNHGLSHGKFYYVPNGVVLDDWDKPLDLTSSYLNFFQSLRERQKTIVGFTGAHGIANSLNCVINAVFSLKNENIVLVLVGNGQEKNNLVKYVDLNRMDNIYFLDPVDKLAIPNILREMDILYIGLQKQSLFRFGISPNKIFDYMMAAKPIVQAIEAGNNIVDEAKCGLYAEPDNVTDIANAILKIKNMSLEERSQLGMNGYNFVHRYHTYNVLSLNYINIMKKLNNNENSYNCRS